jgi:hypothetical protein
MVPRCVSYAHVEAAVRADQYTWIFGVTVVLAFAAAFGIGANDLANSFATSLGSRALSLGAVRLF